MIICHHGRFSLRRPAPSSIASPRPSWWCRASHPDPVCRRASRRLGRRAFRSVRGRRRLDRVRRHAGPRRAMRLEPVEIRFRSAALRWIFHPSTCEFLQVCCHLGVMYISARIKISNIGHFRERLKCHLFVTSNVPVSSSSKRSIASQSTPVLARLSRRWRVHCLGYLKRKMARLSRHRSRLASHSPHSSG